MNFKTTQLDNNTTKHHIENKGVTLNYSEWIDSITTSDKAILRFNDVLKDSKYDAFFWEVKPVNKNALKEPFEFVLIQSNSLQNITADDSAFKKYFKEGKSVVNFPNLRGDAELIVPTPISDVTDYAHLSNFVRSADEKQIIEFWSNVAENYKEKIGVNTKWLSTSGLGVHWLHVRIDTRPKYYQHKEYKF